MGDPLGGVGGIPSSASVDAVFWILGDQAAAITAATKHLSDQLVRRYPCRDTGRGKLRGRRGQFFSNGTEIRADGGDSDSRQDPGFTRVHEENQRAVVAHAYNVA